MRLSNSVHIELTIASFSLSTSRMSNTDEIVSFLYNSWENAALNALQTMHITDKVFLSSDRCHDMRLRATVSMKSESVSSRRNARTSSTCYLPLFAFKFMLVMLKSAFIFVSYIFHQNGFDSVP